MTANAFATDRKKALEMGMNGHIAKPINGEKIQDALAPILMEKGIKGQETVLGRAESRRKVAFLNGKDATDLNEEG